MKIVRGKDAEVNCIKMMKEIGGITNLCSLRDKNLVMCSELESL